jgi:integrase
MRRYITNLVRPDESPFPSPLIEVIVTKPPFIPQDFQNPCDTPILKKMFKAKPTTSWEIIFTTVKPRNRLILELMARGGMRVGEVLKLRPRSTTGN